MVLTHRCEWCCLILRVDLLDKYIQNFIGRLIRWPVHGDCTIESQDKQFVMAWPLLSLVKGQNHEFKEQVLNGLT